MFRTNPNARRRSPRALVRRAILCVEHLETRNLLSASNLLQPLAFPVDPPNDTYYNLQWDMAGGFGSNAQAAWQAGYTGLNAAPVYIGVVDEGIQYLHLDLVGRVRNPGEIAGNKKDDDKNGKVDDAYGWDFVSNNNSVYDGTQDDHGTHVAGTIGANGNNGIGVAGIDWNVGLISAKFLGPNGGSTSAAASAINYLVDLKVNHGVNIAAINASWGGGGYSQTLFNAIKKAGDANILFVAAAGNNGTNTDVTPFYPSSYNLNNIITVAAIDQSGGLASWSNYGATSVDFGAPGVSIASTVPSGKYAYYSGTSMAAPHVTGAIALYAAYHPDATATQIKSALLSSVTPTASLAGKTVTGGRLDIYKFVTSAPAVAGTSVKPAVKSAGTDDTLHRTGITDSADPSIGFILLPPASTVQRGYVQLPPATVVVPPQGPVFVPLPAQNTISPPRLVTPVTQGNSEGDLDVFAFSAVPGNRVIQPPRSSGQAVNRDESTRGAQSVRWTPAVDAVFAQQTHNKDETVSAPAADTTATVEEKSLAVAFALIAATMVFGTNGDSPNTGWRRSQRLIR